MLNYLKAELYKGSRPRVLFSVALTFGGLEGAYFLIRLVSAVSWSLEDWVKALLDLLISGLFLLVVPAGIVFSEQYKHATLKNEVCFGIPRGRVYLGKLLASATLAAFFCAGMVLLWFALGGVFVRVQPGGDWVQAATELGLGLLTALPLWLGALGLFHALQFTVKSTPLVYTLYLGYFLVAEPAISLLRLLNKEKVGPALFGLGPFLSGCVLSGPLIDGLSVSPGPGLLARAWLVGMAWLVATTAIGLAFFYRQNIQ